MERKDTRVRGRIEEVAGVPTGREFLRTPGRRNQSADRVEQSAGKLAEMVVRQLRTMKLLTIATMIEAGQPA